jgi:PKD domain
MHVRVSCVACAAALALLLATPARAGVHVWSGAMSFSWSNPGNWSGGAPTAIETSVVLVFPPAATKISVNDISGLTVDTLTIADGGYTISGDAISLGTGITTSNTFSAGLSDVMLDIALTQPTVIGLSGAGLLELFGVVSGGPGAPISVSGVGSLSLRGANTFQGVLDVDTVTLYASDHDSALGAPSAGTSISNGGQLALQGIFTAEPLSLGNGTTLAGASGGSLVSGDVVVTGSVSFFVNTSSLLTVSGVVSGTGGVVLGGTGRLVLSGLDTYAGGTTDAPTTGTLVIDGAVAGNVTVTNATLGGGRAVDSNSIGGTLTAGAGATIRPGDSPGWLGAGGNITLTAGTTVAIELNGTAPEAYDTLSTNGALTLGNATLSPSRGFAASMGDVFYIGAAVGGVSGTFNGLADGASLMIGTQPFTIHYLAQYVTLTATGSPSCILDCAASGPSVLKAATSADFTGSSSLPCGAVRTLTQYEWDFGDLSPRAALASPSHYYPRPGTYSWRMSASTAGISCTKTGTIHVTISGDVNGDGNVDIADVFFLINYLFANGPLLGWGDADGSTTVDVADVFYLINYLFANGPAPV